MGELNKKFKKDRSEEYEIVLKKRVTISDTEAKLPTKILNAIRKDIHPTEAAYFHICTLLFKWKEAKLFSTLTSTNNTPAASEVVVEISAALPTPLNTEEEKFVPIL